MSKQLSLKEELEILRGEPIQVFTGDPMDIPCIETSDPERLCKHPVVSVHMITYNHEPYIRQAIEGVMMQKTDFELELVIGEDCSTDKTREICFEYQKRYPDKIRVLWSHENITVKHPHPAGHNSARVDIRCRGEFIAYCEGDDYWIDPLKLQKQVDVMRRFPNVGMSFTGAREYFQDDDIFKQWECRHYSPGVIAGRQYALYTMFGANPLVGTGQEGFVMTASVMVRKSVLSDYFNRFNISKWRLTVGDTQLSVVCGILSDIYFLQDETAVYRHTRSGAMGTNGARVNRDSDLARLYFAAKAFDLTLEETPCGLGQRVLLRLSACLEKEGLFETISYLLRITRSSHTFRFWYKHLFVYFLLIPFGSVGIRIARKYYSLKSRIVTRSVCVRVECLYKNVKEHKGVFND